MTITFCFHIDVVNRARFLDLMREVRLMHLRNGAFSWRLDEDLSERTSFESRCLLLRGPDTFFISFFGYLRRFRFRCAFIQIRRQALQIDHATSACRIWPKLVYELANIGMP